VVNSDIPCFRRSHISRNMGITPTMFRIVLYTEFYARVRVIIRIRACWTAGRLTDKCVITWTKGHNVYYIMLSWGKSYVFQNPMISVCSRRHDQVRTTIDSSIYLSLVSVNIIDRKPVFSWSIFYHNRRASERRVRVIFETKHWLLKKKKKNCIKRINMSYELQVQQRDALNRRSQVKWYNQRAPTRWRIHWSLAGCVFYAFLVSFRYRRGTRSRVYYERTVTFDRHLFFLFEGTYYKYRRITNNSVACTLYYCFGTFLLMDTFNTSM